MKQFASQIGMGRIGMAKGYLCFLIYPIQWNSFRSIWQNSYSLIPCLPSLFKKSCFNFLLLLLDLPFSANPPQAWFLPSWLNGIWTGKTKNFLLLNTEDFEVAVSTSRGGLTLLITLSFLKCFCLFWGNVFCIPSYLFGYSFVYLLVFLLWPFNIGIFVP